MWYYESLANQWPAPAWATDSQRFANCNVIMVQFLRRTIINLEPVLGKDFRTELASQGSTCLCHSYEPVRISRPRRRGPLIGQRFVVPQNSQTTPNQWPENLRSPDLPTYSIDLVLCLCPPLSPPNELVQGVAMSTSAVMPFSSFVQTPVLSVSPSSLSLQRLW